MEEIEIYSQDAAITVTKENGTTVAYYLSNEFEVHHNSIAAHSTQEWHYHKRIEEVLYIVSGSLDILWQEDNQIHRYKANPKDLIRVKQSYHTIENPNEEDAIFIVFRFVPDGISKKDIIKNDKYLEEQ